MGIVQFTPAVAERAVGGASPVVRAMQIGQYVIAAVLAIIGAVRAIGDGVPPAVAVLCGVAILAWQALGGLLLARSRTRSAAAWWLVGLAAVWIAAVAVSPEFVWVAFLLWLLAGHLLPGGWALVFSGAVFGIVVLAPILHHGATSYANVFGPLVGGVFALGISRGYLELLRDAAERERLVASLTQARQEMADLQDELALTQRHSGALAERTRLSRDIHDTIAQALSSIRLLAHAGATRTQEKEAAGALQQIEALAGDSLGDVRRIVAALVPAELERTGEPGSGSAAADDALAAALQRLLDRMEAREEAAGSADDDPRDGASGPAGRGIRTELHVDAARPVLPSAVEVALLRTAQSALANVRLHSGATRVVMSLIDDGDEVRLDVIDDGRGFDAAAWERSGGSGRSDSGYGLRFMRERLRELGGGLDIESSPGRGTALSAHLPIHLPGQVRGDTAEEVQ